MSETSIRPVGGRQVASPPADHAAADAPLVWTGGRAFAPKRFRVELADPEDDIFETADMPFRVGIAPGLRLLRTPTAHWVPTPAGGAYCLVDSPDAQITVRLEPDFGAIDVYCLEDPIAAVRFCEYVAAACDATRWRVRDMTSDDAPPAVGSPAYAMLFGRVASERHSAVQHIVLSDHPVYGEILVLGGEIQIGARDVETYSRELVDPGVTASARTALILGGGDCGVLRAVLRHPFERAVMVELDPDVIDFCRTHMPDAAGDALEDERAEIRFEDAFAYIRDCEERFDLIVWDLPDAPIGGLSILDRVATLATLLTPDGRLVVHADCWDPEGPNDDVPTVAALRRHFANVEMRRRALPSFQDYPWLFLCAWAPRPTAA